ncbi:LLM class flavin-dependent oxidoreductase [Pseudonocardia sp. NPDC046786]|uniref:LLM class flavin-dependent oxidoreductase n=1 Tax=Pseudonocardia sp. NPDC046786 TaxID=3155471 RepID=UPI0033FF5F51
MLGLADRLPARDAAVLNGVLIHGMDFDDTHIPAVTHASAAALPAALAAAIAAGADTRALLLAYVLGVEVSARVGIGGAGGFHDVGFHPTAVAGAFGAAVAAGKVSGLDAAGITTAQGVVGSMSAGLLEFLADGSWTKRLHPGWAAMSGLTAAGFAKAGWSGPPAVYEGRFGLYNTHLAGRDTRPEAVGAGLGETWELMRGRAGRRPGAPAPRAGQPRSRGTTAGQRRDRRQIPRDDRPGRTGRRRRPGRRPCWDSATRPRPPTSPRRAVADRPVQVGVFLTHQQPAGRDPQAAPDDRLRPVRDARVYADPGAGPCPARKRVVPGRLRRPRPGPVRGGLAAVTERIKLYASTAVLTLPPALVARMATTIDSIAPGRFGINIVSGWAKGEYEQMGLWPGDDYFGYRYDYSTEYVRMLRDLFVTGRCDLQGEHFTMNDCVLSPLPSGHVDIVCAGQSERGMRMVAEYGDYNFVLSPGVNDLEVYRESTQRLAKAAEATGRDVGSLPLFMAIMAETDEEAQAKWASYNAGADAAALGYMSDEGSKDATADDSGTARTINLPEGAVNFNMATLVGSYETVARQIDQVATMPGVKGMMFTFDDFEQGVHDFGTRVKPLLG